MTSIFGCRNLYCHWQLAEPCKFTKWLCDLQISVSYCKLAYSCLVLKIKIDQKDVIENILINIGVYKIQQYYNYVDNSVSLNHENTVSKINLSNEQNHNSIYRKTYRPESSKKIQNTFSVFSSPHCNFKNFTFASLKNNTNKYKKHFTKMLADVGIKSLKLQKQDRRDLSLNRDQIPKTTKTRL